MTDDVPNETNSTPQTAFFGEGDAGTGRQPQFAHTRSGGGTDFFNPGGPRGNVFQQHHIIPNEIFLKLPGSSLSVRGALSY